MDYTRKKKGYTADIGLDYKNITREIYRHRIINGLHDRDKLIYSRYWIIKTLLKPYYYLTIYTRLKSIIIILHTTLGA
jgi:hypothetical protein